MRLAEPAGVFPLPLTPFERYILADESARYPMTFFLQLRFRGPLQRPLLELAVDQALHRHPLLCSRVELQNGVPHWIWAPEFRQPIEWNKSEWIRKRPWAQPRDLRTHIGVEGWADTSGDETEMTLQFHHACCDGIGASQFLEDVAVGYAQLAAVHTSATDIPQYRPLDPQLLHTRDSEQGRRIANLSGSVFRRCAVIARYTLKYLRQRIVPLTSVSKQGNAVRDQSDDDTGLVFVQLSKAVTRGLRNAAKHHSATLNDLLVRDLMIAAQQWNSRAAETPSGNSICILTPNSLRGPNDDTLPAANVVGYVFLTRSLSELTNRTALLCSLRDEMQLVHKYQAGWFFLQSIRSMQKFLPLLNLYLRRSHARCMSTAVLSHLGNTLNSISGRLPMRDGRIMVGDVELMSICCIPPIRPNTHLVLATMLMHGQLVINARMNPLIFSRSDTEQFVQSFIKILEQSAGEHQNANS